MNITNLVLLLLFKQQKPNESLKSDLFTGTQLMENYQTKIYDLIGSLGILTH
jgi:hypothetical protein